MTTSEQGVQENATTNALREDIAKLQDHHKEQKTRLHKTIAHLQDRHEELKGKIRSSQEVSPSCMRRPAIQKARPFRLV